MSGKFFSLIQNGILRSSPKKKIIPKEEFSTLLDAKEMVTQVQKDGERYRIEIRKEIEKQSEIAFQKGFAKGLNDWAKHIKALENQIQKVHEEVEKKIIPVALKAARKILGREVELNEATVADIVKNCLKPVSQHKKITINVNKKDLDILEANRPKLREVFEHLESLTIRERADVLPLGCIIETEGGIITAQLEDQWQALEQVFETLLKQKEGSTTP